MYFGCPGCGLGEFGADRAVGIDGGRTARARRMACLAGVEQSFDRGARLLAELAGWRLDGETVRRLCHAEAGRAAAWQAAAEQPARRLAQAAGDWELHVDAGKVNTTGGWRDVKVAVFARREPGPPAGAAAWDGRELPRPGARLVWAAVEEAARFGPRLRAQAGRLGLAEAKDLTVLADGADWIGSWPRPSSPARRACWTSSTPASTWPPRASGPSAKAAPGPRPGWSRAGGGCWRTAGRACWTPWAGCWPGRTRPSGTRPRTSW